MDTVGHVGGMDASHDISWELGRQAHSAHQISIQRLKTDP